MLREPVYANFTIVKGWICWAVLLPVLGGSTLVFTNDDPATNELAGPLWLGLIAYGVVCVGQYTYFKYAPTAVEAARISRKFVWWKRLSIVPIHCAILFAFFATEYRSEFALMAGMLGGLAYWSIVPIWNRDLEKKIRL